MSKSRPTPYDCLDKEQIAPTLHELRLPGMLNSYLTQKKILGISEYSFEDRLGMMLYEEVTGRNYRRQARLFQASGLRNTGASAGTILYDKERNLDKGLVTELMSCRWIQSDCPPNLIVTGAAGTGKTFLVEAIGRSATQEGISVAYWRFPQLLEKMTEAFNRNESNALRRRINSKRLLIIDDFAMAPLNDQMRTDLLSLIDDRLGIYATIISAQLPFKNWYKYIGEAYHADALMDRLKNHSYQIELKGRSMREREIEF